MPNVQAIPDPTGVRAAEAEANKRAQAVAEDRSEGFTGFSSVKTPMKVSHTTKMRAADSGYVGGSPAELKERMGQYQMGGELAFRPTGAPEAVPVIPSEPTADLISHEGVPDLPALRRHNAALADSIEATALSQIAASDPVTALAPEVLAETVNPQGDRTNTVEGVLSDQAQAEQDKAEAKADKKK